MPPGVAYRPPQKKNVPSWWNKIKNKLSQLGNGNSGSSTYTYRPTLPATSASNLSQQGPTYRPSQNANRRPPWRPGQITVTPNQYNATPPPAPIPTGSFLAANGQYALGTQQQAVPTTIPTGSFLGGGGQYVLGGNQQAYLINRRPTTGTFIAAGGEAVRGPDIAVATVEEPSSGGGSGGYSGYKRKKGGGRAPAPQPTYQPREDYGPAWARGLANWSIG